MLASSSSLLASSAPRARRLVPLAAALRRGHSASATMAKLLQPQEAADLLRQGTHSYLDVRTPEEFAAGHVEGAVNIPLMLATATGGKEPNPDFLQQVKQQFPNTDQALVVGCKAGGRSATACKMLTAESYTNLLDQTAGFDGWLAAKLPVKQ